MTGDFDRRRRQYLPLDVFVAFDDFGSSLIAKWGMEGVCAWMLFLAACKREPVQGTFTYTTEEEAWRKFGAAPTLFSLDEFFRFTGRWKKTGRKRSGRIVYVSVKPALWSKWNNVRVDKDTSNTPPTHGQHTTKTAPTHAQDTKRDVPHPTETPANSPVIQTDYRPITGPEVEVEVEGEDEEELQRLTTTLVVVEEEPKLTKLEGRDTAFDVLVQVCGIDPRSQRVTDVAVALRGARGKPGIRRMFWEEQGGVKGDAFERLLTAEIQHRADVYRRKMPGATLTPTALQKWWFDVLTMPEPSSGVATVEERLWHHANQLEERRSLEAG